MAIAQPITTPDGPRIVGDPARGDSLMRASLFGTLHIQIDGRVLGPRDFLGVKPRQVLEVLLLARGNTVPKERLGDLLWGERIPRNLSATLETYVSVLRSRLDPAGSLSRLVIRTERGAYRVPAEAVSLDLEEFDVLTRQARGLPVAEAVPLLDRAVALVTGEVLEDEPYAAWVERIRETYRVRYIDALCAIAAARLETGDYAGAADAAETVLALDPINERGCRSLMIAYYGSDRREMALRVFGRFREELLEELGVQPAPRTVSILEAMARHADPRSLDALTSADELAV